MKLAVQKSFWGHILYNGRFLGHHKTSATHHEDKDIQKIIEQEK